MGKRAGCSIRAFALQEEPTVLKLSHVHGDEDKCRLPASWEAHNDIDTSARPRLKERQVPGRQQSDLTSLPPTSRGGHAAQESTRSWRHLLIPRYVRRPIASRRATSFACQKDQVRSSVDRSLQLLPGAFEQLPGVWLLNCWVAGSSLTLTPAGCWQLADSRTLETYDNDAGPLTTTLRTYTLINPCNPDTLTLHTVTQAPCSRTPHAAHAVSYLLLLRATLQLYCD